MSPGPIEELDAAMTRALALAERGRGRVSPNPLVGCVIRGPGGEPVGEGWHDRIGEAHAERAAIEDARRHGAELAGASMYVTLEPCAHEGRQPPCTAAILEAGIARVVIASGDPSSKAAGRGPAILREAGVAVEFAPEPVRRSAELLNQPFRKHSRSGRPHVVLKSAATLDGRTATAGGDSKWISGAESRALVHEWRSELDGVAVGIGTALADDPRLTARDLAEPAEARQPRRIVFDSGARLPLGSRLIATLGEAPLTVVCGPPAPVERVAELRAAGAEVIELETRGEPALGEALDALGDAGVTSLLLEGGPTLAGAFRDAGEIDELRLFVAPLLLGGTAARPVLGGRGAAEIADASRAEGLEARMVGEDVLLRARLRDW